MSTNIMQKGPHQVADHLRHQDDYVCCGLNSKGIVSFHREFSRRVPIGLIPFHDTISCSLWFPFFHASMTSYRLLLQRIERGVVGIVTDDAELGVHDAFFDRA